jgi:predicted CXXCH cytochrome family protein
MIRRGRPNSKLCPSRWRRRDALAPRVCLGVAVAIAGFAWVVGCTPERKYKVLSFFFDGVPDPNAPPVAAADSGATAGLARANVLSSHVPFRDQQCNACHKGSEGTQVRFAAITSAVCLECHQDLGRKHAVAHEPVAQAECLWCHHPHESALPVLLKEPAPALCTQCHDELLLGDKPPEHKRPNVNCMHCHLGHGGATRAMLRPDAPTSLPLPGRPASRPASAPSTRPIPSLDEFLNASTAPPAPPPLPTARINIPATRPSAAARPALPETRPAGGNIAETSLTNAVPRTGPRPFVLLSDLPPAPADGSGAPGEAPGEGPVLIGVRPKTDAISLAPPTAALEFIYRREDDSLDPQNGQRTTFREDRFDERLTLETTGHIVHPNLVELSLKGTFGFQQDEVSNSGVVDSSNSFFYNYDVSALILRKEEAPTTLYSRRTTETVSRAFGPSLDTNIMSTGGIIDWRNPALPTRIEAYHSDQDQRAVDGSESFNLSQNTVTWHSEATPLPQQRFVFDYTYNQIDERSRFGDTGAGAAEPVSQSNSFDTHEVIATHSWDFGTANRHNLGSSVSYFNQSGDFPLERLRWDERLTLRHSDTFETRYLYTLDYQSSSFDQGVSSDQTQHTGQAGFVHRLYKSLITTGNAGVRQLDRSDGSASSEFFGDLNFDYTKQVPLGRLNAAAGYAFNRQENDAQSGVVSVINEPRTFNDPLPIIITGTNVDANSVVVRNANGLIEFVEGADYLVADFPDRVEISRVVGGRIANGQAVLVSYDLLPQGQNTVTNNTFSVGLRYDVQRGPLAGLGLYARFLRLDQQIDADDPGAFVPNSLTDTRLGAEYRVGDLTVGAEQEWHDSDIAPYDASRLFARYDRRLTRDASLSLNANYTRLTYPDTDNRVDLFVVTGTAGQRFTRDLFGSVTLLYRNQEDRQFGNTEGFEASGELRWDYRQTHVYVQARQTFLDTDTEASSYQTLVVGVRREF